MKENTQEAESALRVLLLLFEVIQAEVDFNLNVGLVYFGGVTAQCKLGHSAIIFHHVKIYEPVHLEKGYLLFFT
jgi:hypothetical protein